MEQTASITLPVFFFTGPSNDVSFVMTGSEPVGFLFGQKKL